MATAALGQRARQPLQTPATEYPALQAVEEAGGFVSGFLPDSGVLCVAETRATKTLQQLAETVWVVCSSHFPLVLPYNTASKWLFGHNVPYSMSAPAASLRDHQIALLRRCQAHLVTASKDQSHWPQSLSSVKRPF